MKSEEEIRDEYIKYFKEWQTTENISEGYKQYLKGYFTALSLLLQEDNQ